MLRDGIAILLQPCGQCRWREGNKRMIHSCPESLEVNEYLVKATPPSFRWASDELYEGRLVAPPCVLN